MVWIVLVMALRELRRNGLRSVLTTLGILIGVGSVIVLVTLGRSASSQISSEISSMGTNLLLVMPEAEQRGPTSTPAPPFSDDDVRLLRRELAALAQLAPASSASMTVVAGNRNHQTVVVGTTNDYFAVRDLTLERGSSFESREDAGAPGCIIGATLSKELFSARDPLGQSVRIGSLSCPIIGLLRSKGRSSMGPDQDDLLLLPLAAFQRRVAGRDDVDLIFVSVRAEALLASAQERAQSFLHQRRRIPKGRADNFKVHDMKQLTGALSTVTGALTALLGAIAAVSLVVGGIGIMNIMLVSVTERTREIGVRLALGALSRDVLLQFLTEAVLLSMLGGALGVGLGLVVSGVVAYALGLPFTVHADVVLLALGFAATIGVAFGFLPARKAARFDPIVALARE